jgi:hypothetical protein
MPITVMWTTSTRHAGADSVAAAVDAKEAAAAVVISAAGEASTAPRMGRAGGLT